MKIEKMIGGGLVIRDMRTIAVNWSEDFYWNVEVSDENVETSTQIPKIHQLDIKNIDEINTYEDTSGWIKLPKDMVCLVEKPYGYTVLTCMKKDEVPTGRIIQTMGEWVHDTKKN